jgi:hypothetical protein
MDKDINKMVAFINRKGTQVYQKLLDYSIRWKQPINVSKTAILLFHTQVRRPIVEIYMSLAPTYINVFKRFRDALSNSNVCTGINTLQRKC